MSQTVPDTVWGVEWESTTYEKPWRDTSFLRELYESDREPTYDDLADVLGCSASTVQKYMPDGAQRGGPGLPYEDVAMFSGGYDSLVAVHYSMEELDCDVVMHIDTGTGIDDNVAFVRHVCDVFGWPLEIVSSSTSLKEFALEHGFPKAGAHSWIYRYLKEHAMSGFTTDLETDTPHYYTGVRRAESDRRMRTVSAEQQESSNGRWVWEAPIADWTDEDIADYIVENGLPRNRVVETIGRSGECFCGAYADRWSELTTLEQHYPNHYQWILETEDEVQEDIGDDEDYCYWGAAGMEKDSLQQLMDADDAVDEMTLCADCEGGGHRSVGHDQDPTYETVYLAGPRDSNTPTWREQMMAYDETVNWIDPFSLHDYDDPDGHTDEIYTDDCNGVLRSDALVVRYEGGYPHVGAGIEVGVAVQHGVPVIAWNATDETVPLMLRGAATAVCDDRLTAVQTALSYGRTVVRNDGEQVLVR